MYASISRLMFFFFVLFFLKLSLAWLPVLSLSDSSTAWFARSSRVSIPLFAAVDASSERILAEVIPVQRRRRLAALPLLLCHVVACPDRFCHPVQAVVHGSISG